MHPLILLIAQHFKGLEVISSCFDHLPSLLSTSRYRHFSLFPLLLPALKELYGFLTADIQMMKDFRYLRIRPRFHALLSQCLFGINRLIRLEDIQNLDILESYQLLNLAMPSRICSPLMGFGVFILSKIQMSCFIFDNLNGAVLIPYSCIFFLSRWSFFLPFYGNFTARLPFQLNYIDLVAIPKASQIMDICWSKQERCYVFYYVFCYCFRYVYSSLPVLDGITAWRVFDK